MSDLFAPIEPYDAGLLDVGDGQRIYWESCGNPHGKPALYLHGGPGSGCTQGSRRFFDPAAYRIILFDQRGCGRSVPLASEVDADLRANTTAHLVSDIESLRRQLAIDSWTILGVSWGTTLALAYAQTHRRRVDALVLALVTTTSRREVQWLTEGVGAIFPREWERFASAVPAALRDRPLVDAYAEMLFDRDPAIREHAAREWCTWEDAHVSLSPGHRPNPRFEDAEYRLRFARLVTHYWKHAAFLGDEQLVRNAEGLNGIPGLLIHGRLDVSSPLDTARFLSAKWATSELLILDDAGHGGGTSFVSAIVEALKRGHKIPWPD